MAYKIKNNTTFEELKEKTFNNDNLMSNNNQLVDTTINEEEKNGYFETFGRKSDEIKREMENIIAEKLWGSAPHVSFDNILNFNFSLYVNNILDKSNFLRTIQIAEKKAFREGRAGITIHPIGDNNFVFTACEIPLLNRIGRDIVSATIITSYQSGTYQYRIKETWSKKKVFRSAALLKEDGTEKDEDWTSAITTLGISLPMTEKNTIGRIPLMVIENENPFVGLGESAYASLKSLFNQIDELDYRMWWEINFNKSFVMLYNKGSGTTNLDVIPEQHKRIDDYRKTSVFFNNTDMYSKDDVGHTIYAGNPQLEVYQRHMRALKNQAYRHVGLSDDESDRGVSNKTELEILQYRNHEKSKTDRKKSDREKNLSDLMICLVSYFDLTQLIPNDNVDEFITQAEQTLGIKIEMGFMELEQIVKQQLISTMTITLKILEIKSRQVAIEQAAALAQIGLLNPIRALSDIYDITMEQAEKEYVKILELQAIFAPTNEQESETENEKEKE